MTITKLTIGNLRGVKTGELSGLSPLSILVGPNNCGKSTTLEALATLGSGQDIVPVIRRLLRRGGPPSSALPQAFHAGGSGFEVRAEVAEGADSFSIAAALRREGSHNATRLAAARTEGLQDPMEPYRLDWTSGGAGPEQTGSGAAGTQLDHRGRTAMAHAISGRHPERVRTAFVDLDAVRSGTALEDAYSALEGVRRVPQVVAALGGSMAGLTDLKILKVGGDYVLHAIAGQSTPTPVYAAGDGFKRLLQVAAALYSNHANTVLLEEPECFQHPRYLGELVRMLRGAAADGQQVILSTHSIELIDRLLGTVDDHPGGEDWPTVHRLRLTAGVLRATTLSAAQARAAREELLEDLRA